MKNRAFIKEKNLGGAYMQKTLVKIIALMMAMMMVLTLAACGDKPAETKPTESTQAQADSSSAPEPQKTAEPVTLKFWTADGSKGTSGVQDNTIMKELANRTGITIDFEFNVTMEKYNAMLASGDLPDVLTTKNSELKPLIDGGNVIDMEPLLKDHGQDIMTETPNKVAFSKEFFSEGQNKLYFLPTWDLGEDFKPVKSFNNATGIGMFIRWDYYKEIGYPELKDDITEIIPILKQMQEKHPKTEEGKKVYGLSPWLADWDLWNFTVLYQGYDNVDAEREKFIDIGVKDGTFKSQIGDTTSTMWKGAKFFNKAYQAGVLDPDSVMQKYDQTVEKQNGGRVLANFVSWSVGGANGNFAKLGHPEQGFMGVKMPASVTQMSNFSILPYGDRWSHAITTKCKTPERAMDLLNFVHSSEGMRLLLNGIEGTHWKVDSDGKPRLLPETIKILQGSSEQQETEGFGAYTHLYGRSQDVQDPKYSCYINYMYNEDIAKRMENATPFEKDYVQHYGVTYPDEVFEKALPGNQVKADGTYLTMAAATPAEIKQIDANLLNYLKAEMVKIVLTKSDAEFEAKQKKIIEDCKGMGYEKAYDWHMKNFVDAKAKTDAWKTKIGK
jgi:putative aldouronate transport system substrate-binding protein